MSFENFQKKRSRRKIGNPQELNNHINFSKEHHKGNARKDATKVVCVQCGKRFVLPFKPRHPEVYCDKCFKKRK